LTVNTEGLLRDLEGIVARTPEGMVLLVDTTRIPDKEAILLHLLRAYLAQQLSMGQRDSLPISEILRITGGKPGAIAGRLSELTSEGLVERVGKGEYRVTTLGIKWIVEKVLPKLKEGG
jgi:DNA-binding transcriptional ArsR family regulator